MTGHGDVSTAVRAMKGGAVDSPGEALCAPDLLAYLQKPFREDALIAAVQQALEGRRA